MTPDTPADGAELAKAITELPMVKPLEWKYGKIALGVNVRYTIYQGSKTGKWAMQTLTSGQMAPPILWLESSDLAHAVAQADHEARVRALLIPRPAEPAQAAPNDHPEFLQAQADRDADIAANLEDLILETLTDTNDLDVSFVDFSRAIVAAIRKEFSLTPRAAAQEGRE